MCIVHAATVPEQKRNIRNVPHSPRLQSPRSLPFLDALLIEILNVIEALGTKTPPYYFLEVVTRIQLG
jgi:hypothetical protein